MNGANYPDGLLGHVLEAGAYRQAKQMRESAERSSNPSEAIKALPREGLVALVPEIDYAIANGEEGE